MEGHYSPTTPFINRSTHSKVRWRPEFSEYQCDDCHQSIRTVFPEPVVEEEGEVEYVIDTDDENEIEAASVAPPVPESEV